MNINRHNYESFFMLYIDKELSGEERQSVEVFVENNADLKIELEQLQLAVLPLIEFPFENKAQLLQKETFSEADEENLMLLLDGELNAAETKILEGKIKSQPALADAWATLKITKLNAADDAVVFENKEVLYRKEEKVRPLFFIMRWAVAAALVGFGFYAGFKMLDKEVSSLPYETATTKITEAPTKVLVSSKKDSNNVGTTDKSAIANAALVNETISTSVKNKMASATAYSESNKGNNFKKTALENNNIIQEKIPLLLASNGDNIKIKKYPAIDADPELAADLPANRPELMDINIMDAQQNSSALRTAFKGNNEGDRILYMDKEVVEKSKVGKFLKKVKNSLSGDIEIKSEKTLKIAGFEFALK